MQNNLIYLCGPHGSGKTTLGKELARDNPGFVIPELFSRNVKFNSCDATYRQILKIGGRAIENFEYLEIAKKNSSKIILGNRGIYDVLAYNQVYFQKGWIDEKTYEQYDSYTLQSFREENSAPLAVVLNPGIDVVKKHLEIRWIQKGKKWREEDLDYANLVCKAYERFKNNANIFYLNRETDLESRVDIKKVGEWIMSKFKSQ